MRACKKQFETEQSKLPPNERRPVPDAPSQFEEIKIQGMKSADMDKYNEEAFKNYNEKALVPCENCGRTFLPDRLVVHLRSCKPKGEKPEPKNSKLLVRKKSQKEENMFSPPKSPQIKGRIISNPKVRMSIQNKFLGYIEKLKNEQNGPKSRQGIRKKIAEKMNNFMQPNLNHRALHTDGFKDINGNKFDFRNDE